MVKEEIRIEKIIVHILDSTVGMPVLSDTEIDFGSDFADFIKEHIYKVAAGDDVRTCAFYERESEVCQMLREYQDEDFIPLSKKLAESLYQIMNSNVDIPSASLLLYPPQKGHGFNLIFSLPVISISLSHNRVAAASHSNNLSCMGSPCSASDNN